MVGIFLNAVPREDLFLSHYPHFVQNKVTHFVYFTTCLLLFLAANITQEQSILEQLSTKMNNLKAKLLPPGLISFRAFEVLLNEVKLLVQSTFVEDQVRIQPEVRG
jgi:hypothetical protein